MAIGVLVIAIGGSAAWFMLGGDHDNGMQAHAKSAKPAKPESPPLFLALESFTVNLQTTDSDHFLQTEVTLRVADEQVIGKIKLHMPEVRNRVLMLLSSKSPQELVTIAGKNKLAEDIRAEITRVIDPEAIEPEAPVTLAKEPVEDMQAAPPEAENADAAAADKAIEEDADADPRVKSVLFTSFIIQ